MGGIWKTCTIFTIGTAGKTSDFVMRDIVPSLNTLWPAAQHFAGTPMDEVKKSQEQRARTPVLPGQMTKTPAERTQEGLRTKVHREPVTKSARVHHEWDLKNSTDSVDKDEK